MGARACLCRPVAGLPRRFKEAVWYRAMRRHPIKNGLGEKIKATKNKNRWSKSLGGTWGPAHPWGGGGGPPQERRWDGGIPYRWAWWKKETPGRRPMRQQARTFSFRLGLPDNTEIPVTFTLKFKGNFIGYFVSPATSLRHTLRGIRGGSRDKYAAVKFDTNRSSSRSRPPPLRWEVLFIASSLYR